MWQYPDTHLMRDSNHISRLIKLTDLARAHLERNDLARAKEALSNALLEVDHAEPGIILLPTQSMVICGGQRIPFGRQFLLLDLLRALVHEHQRPSSQYLSKAEIIETVWKEPYHAARHDNRLYYNINRLRKLIEPKTRSHQYIQKWRDGYRLTPGLKVRTAVSAAAPPHSRVFNPG